MAVPNPVVVPKDVPKAEVVVVFCAGCPNRPVVPVLAPNPPVAGAVVCPNSPVVAGWAEVFPKRLVPVPKPVGLAAVCPKEDACPKALVVLPKSPPKK